jgi:hypothetical protein
MWPWEVEPRSVAHGILDDETYDWQAVVRAMLATGGRTVVVDEPALRAANVLARDVTGLDADETGSAGIAGLLELALEGALGEQESVAVVLSGVRRHGPHASSSATTSRSASSPAPSSASRSAPASAPPSSTSWPEPASRTAPASSSKVTSSQRSTP